MLKASIDIGSNTTLLLVGEISGDGQFLELENESRVTSLGKNIDKRGSFEASSMDETYKALSEYSEIIRSHKIDLRDVIVSATEASRRAANSSEFFKMILEKLQLKVIIINAEGEAYYTAFGVCKNSKMSGGEAVIMDMGGASTELIKVKLDPFKIVESVSLPFGTIRGTDWISEGKFDENMSEIFNNADLGPYRINSLLCVAGGMTSLAAMMEGMKEFDSARVNGLVISLDRFEEFYCSIRDKSPSFLFDKFPFLGKRSHSIVAGGKIALKVSKILDVQEFSLSTLGLRYGTIFSRGIDKKYREESY